MTSGRVAARADRAVIGKSLVAGDFRFDQRSSPPKLSGRLTGPRLCAGRPGSGRGRTDAGAARPAVALHRVLPQHESTCRPCGPWTPMCKWRSTHST